MLRCGVGAPANLDSTAIPGEIDGIGWYSSPAGNAVIFTTFERIPRVSVAVPNHYTIPFDILVSLSDALKRATKGP